MKIAVKTFDSYLYQKIFLILGKDNEVFRYSPEGEYFDILLSDDLADRERGGVIMSRSGEDELTVPFTEKELRGVLFREESKTPLLVPGERSVYLRGRKISLTELEFSLFSSLYAAGGEFVSREVLHGKVFGEGCTEGALNVYVHYLREKLETEDEKVIISSRKHGYKINERYF